MLRLLQQTTVNASIAAQPMNNSLDMAMLNETRSKRKIQWWRISVWKNEKIADAGMEVPPSMGVATGINFQPLGNGNAAIAGDFALIGNEVNPVIKALGDNNIKVTAIHNHMINENPRLFFLHLWATGDQGNWPTGLKKL